MARLRRLRVDLALALSLTLAIVVSAIIHQGIPAVEVKLNDGGVWVINSQLRLAAHLNYQSRVLDGGLRATAPSFDLHQAANDVVLEDRTSARLHQIRTADVVLGDQASVGGGLHFSFGGGAVGIIDPKQGKVWVVDADDLGSFTPEADPLLGDAKGAALVAGTDGSVHLVARDGAVRTLSRHDGAWSVVAQGRLKAALGDGELRLSAAGDHVAVLDVVANRLVTEAATYEVADAARSVLQLVGDDHDQILLQTPTALMAFGLTSKRTEMLATVPSGGVIAPAYLAGCAYAAWPGTGQYARRCGSEAATQQIYPQLASAKDLQFRVSRDVIVLNDGVTGATYLVNEGMAVVDNWDTIRSQVQTDDERESDQESSEITDSISKVDPDSQHRPVANPDVFGVRAGGATTLPVLQNDTDQDGDVLTADIDGKADGPYELGSGQGGRSVRVEVPAEASGSMQFRYRADDGQESSEPAAVTVRVRPLTVNDAPSQRRRPELKIAERTEAAYAVLADWIDPDGDQMYLQNATGDEGLQVTYRQDGGVTVRDLGTGGAGERTVTVTVSDGRLSAEGTIRVVVQPGGQNSPPVANADFVTTAVGQPVIVSPLRNDTDPNGDRLLLTEVAKPGQGDSITPDYAAGSFQFAAERPGSHIVRYTVADDPSVGGSTQGSSVGEVRIVVVDPAGGSVPPVAENDLALLPVNTSVLVDVLGNDTDPLGGVLVVQNVTRPLDSPLSIEVLDHNTLRVSAPVGLEAPSSFTYAISNGAGSATGKVLVIPLPAAATNRPPVAVADDAVVRAGDIVSVPVLANDYSPANVEFSLEPTIEVNADKPVGEAFVAGDVLRFRASSTPGAARITYTIRDQAGNVASAEVRVSVVAAEAGNQPPRPAPVVARAVAGTTTKIAVPLDGIDPDGDSVQLVGIGTPPGGGATVAVERGFLQFKTPIRTSGTQNFTYRVKDRWGGEAEGSVRVGVAPPPSVNTAPVAVTDTRYVRPGRTVAIAVTGNDVDPDGDTVSLVEGSVTPVDAAGAVPVRLLGQKVELETPQTPTTLQYYYDIVDGRGGTARGVLIVKVAADVPLAAPVAGDDPLTAEEIAGQSELAVDVLTNDVDPDGSVSDLKLSVEAPARVDGDRVVVPVAADRQVVLYTITDPDGLTSKAAVVIPGAAQVAPFLLPDKTATVKAGQRLTVDLADYVGTRASHRAILTTGTKIKLGPGLSDLQPRSEKVFSVLTSKGFSGQTSVSFEVTDGSNVEDPRGLLATLTLPVAVDSAGQTPPVVRPSEVVVSPGGAPKSVSLTPMVTDPDAGDQARLQFSRAEVSGGFTVNVKGGAVAVSAPADLRNGSRGTATISVTDGSSKPVTMVLPLRVVASTRPLIQTTDATISDARSGQPSTVDLTSYITNPFADRKQPVQLVGVPKIVSGRGTVSASGLKVSITPATDFDGQLVVTYTAADATQDSSRYRPGTIRATVKGKPSPPISVVAATKASRSATVSWTAGDLHGGTLKGFTVTWTGPKAGSKACGRQTVCEIAGLLENDREYVFSVIQETEVGISDPSRPSN